MDGIDFPILPFILGIFVGGIVLFIIFIIKNNAKSNKANKIIEDAKKEAEKIKRDRLLETKEEIYRLKQDADKEIKEKKSELKDNESRLITRKNNLDKRNEMLQTRENYIKQKKEK